MTVMNRTCTSKCAVIYTYVQLVIASVCAVKCYVAVQLCNLIYVLYSTATVVLGINRW